MLRIETSAFTLFQQLTVSRKTRPWGRASSGFIEVEKRSSYGLTFQQQRITVRIISVQILPVTDSDSSRMLRNKFIQKTTGKRKSL